MGDVVLRQQSCHDESARTCRNCRGQFANCPGDHVSSTVAADKNLFIRRYVHLCAWNQPLQPPGLASLHWARVGRLTHTTTLKSALVVNNPPQVDHRTVLDTIEGVTVTVDQSVAADPMTWHNLATSCALPAMVASRMSAWRSAIHRTWGQNPPANGGSDGPRWTSTSLNFASRSKFWALNSSSAVASLARRASISAAHAGGGELAGA